MGEGSRGIRGQGTSLRKGVVGQDVSQLQTRSPREDHQPEVQVVFLQRE